jgi:AcrR family transcriptional regulator
MAAPAAAASEHGQRRAAILAAALECFDERGFTATTIEQIRARSGASVGSIYHHFGGKEQIAAELYVDGLRGYQEGVVRAIERHPEDAEAAVRALVRHHLRWVARHPSLARFLMGRRETELRLMTEARVRELNRAFFPRVAAWVERNADAGQLRPLPRDLWEPVLLGPCQELSRLWLSGRARISLRAAEHELAEATWRAIKGGKR